jgi:hypothetical protein
MLLALNVTLARLAGMRRRVTLRLHPPASSVAVDPSCHTPASPPEGPRGAEPCLTGTVEQEAGRAEPADLTLTFVDTACAVDEMYGAAFVSLPESLVEGWGAPTGPQWKPARIMMQPLPGSASSMGVACSHGGGTCVTVSTGCVTPAQMLICFPCANLWACGQVPSQ